ncbi:Taurine dioxygenase [Flagellimonas maritima]|uniref:Taurine dioxygenase n=1 Tax=Flagellimonas maritima TaxID=1383885 RepID=A0A2Z4LR96_9FLAO|nr:TauD/TfdA family dioxygenase [Allomuricauda aurantiaca]AWX44405.1 Taurine dioxygenase [Allomuricauda aurantiaca]
MAYTKFKISELTPHLGAIITDLNLETATYDAILVSELKEALKDYQLLLVKGKTLKPEHQVRFTQVFGGLETFPFRPTQLPKHPEVFRLSTDVQQGYTNVGFYWHQDGSFRERPTALSAFHLVKIPKTGGDTLFANAYEAYKKIPKHLKPIAHKLKTVHEGNILHDLVIEHPVTGKKALYLNMGLVRSLTGFEKEEEAQVTELIGSFQTILDHPEVMYRHKYAEGDLMVSDNYSVFHQATETDPNQERTLHRTTVEGTLTLNRKI